MEKSSYVNLRKGMVIILDKMKISRNLIDLIFLLRHKVFRHIPLPLPLNQFCILALLVHDDKLILSQISTELSIVKQQLSPLIAHLEAEGFVKRSAPDCDKRCVLVSITRRGRKCIDDFHRNVLTSFEEKLSELDENDLLTFSQSVKTMSDICSKMFNDGREFLNNDMQKEPKT